jgi:hypothetical protein
MHSSSLAPPCHSRQGAFADSLRLSLVGLTRTKGCLAARDFCVKWREQFLFFYAEATISVYLASYLLEVS